MLAKFKSEKLKSFIFMATLMVLLITAGMISSALVSDVATQEDPKNKTVSDVVIQYDNTLKVEENSISYDVNVEVIPFDEIDYTYEDIVKKINVSVKYNVDGKAHEYNLTGLKGKVMPSE